MTSGWMLTMLPKQYVSRKGLADVQEMSLEHLGDVKAGSIAEWVNIESVRRAVQKHFRSFLMTYVDDNGQSVYGQRIKHLGEGEHQI